MGRLTGEPFLLIALEMEHWLTDQTPFFIGIIGYITHVGGIILLQVIEKQTTKYPRFMHSQIPQPFRISYVIQTYLKK